ncbi:MAG: hypothetical protein MJZ89_02070 [Paludibacteraceae bacterium]|nr:hypothetical protein [Paludibacteraceae bacterium]
MKLKNIIMAGLALVAGFAFTACETEWPNTDPFNKDGVNVVAYGPNPVARGGVLRFVGTGLDQIKSVAIAGEEITELEVVNSKDLHITVPQTANPGEVVLTTKAGQQIKCNKLLAYTEPVGFAEEKAFAPNPVKPGAELTINGEYLNLVQVVTLADGVVIDKFKEHTREKIVIEKVPAEAQSGKVSLIFYATGDTIPNEIVSKEKLEVVLPAVKSIAELENKKPGDEVVIAGTDMDLVTKVIGTAGEELAFTKTATEVKFNLPDPLFNGIIKVVPASGVEVPVATIGVALPKVVKITPNTGLRADDEVVLSGANFEIASSVSFTADGGKTVEAQIEEGRTASTIKVKLPAAAVSGPIKVNTTAAITVEDEKWTVETLKPTFSAFAPAEQAMGGDVVLQGANMDLVVAVTVTGGAKLETFNVSGSAVTITLPYAAAETGTVTLHMANGETVVTEASLTVNAPVCCYVTAWPELVDDEPIQAGSLLCIEVENSDVLTSVEIDGVECQYILNTPTRLYVNIPASAGKKSHVKLISSNGEIDYAYAFKPNTEVTTVLWTGTAVADDWKDQPYLLSDAGLEFIEAGVVAGDIITFYVTPTDADWKLEILEGHWGPSYAAFCAAGSDTEGGKFTEVDLNATGGKLQLVLTQDMINAAMVQQWWGGIFVANGDNIIVYKITSTHLNRVENTIWSGELVADDWANQPYALTDGGAEFVTYEVAAGMEIYFYITPLDSDWKLEILEGHWGPSYSAFCAAGSDTEGGKFTEVDLSATGGKVGFTLTQEMIDAAMVQQWWGGIFVLNGDNVKVTKITVY